MGKGNGCGASQGSDSATLLAKFNPAATETAQRGAEGRHDDAERYLIDPEKPNRPQDCTEVSI